MAGRWPFTEEKISARLALIAPYIHRRSAPLPHFRMLPLPGATLDAPICADPSGWEEIAHESYWGHADLNFVMKSEFTVPGDWEPEQLALHLPLGVMGDIFNHPEAMAHIDTLPIGSADRYHHTIPLPSDLADGQAHTVSLHGWTGLAGWPPDPTNKRKLFMGLPALVERDPALLAFYNRALAARDTLNVLDHKGDTYRGLLKALDAAFRTLDTRDPIGAALYDSVGAAMAVLEDGIASAGAPLGTVLHGIGHAHMDIAYLWPVSQIRLKNARTYSNVLRLMEEEPDFHFSHSQPQLYAMTAQDHPALFDQIKDRVAEGRWEVMGGMWVEPDLNIPGPEALVRQFTLGRGYFKDTFGDVETPVLWLPDTFGFPAQIPQLARQAGLKWFATNKLNWNQRNNVPASTHHWEGLDGSRLLAHILTTPRDVQYLPFPTNYKSDLSAAEVHGTISNPTIPEQVTSLPICYGYGDGGGGPTEDLLAKARAYRNMPGMPQLKMSTVRKTFDAFEKVSDALPVWKGEHYMEGHRGVLTSQGWIKRANRKAERALHEAEALSAMAGTRPDLTEAWQLLCLNQFHDIVTGTSVPQVFEDAKRDFSRIMGFAEAASQAATDRLEQTTLGIANTSPVTGPRLVLIPAQTGSKGQPVDGGNLVFFDSLPAYSVTPLDSAVAAPSPVTCEKHAAGATLENGMLRVKISQTGQLTGVYDKVAKRDVLKAGETGNQLQAFEDRPVCWDAWDIDPFFEDRMEIVSGDQTFHIIETGPLRASIRVITRWRSSTIIQTIRLAAQSRRLDFETEVDWHEQHTLLKAAFPTSVQAPVAQFDIQWGFVERSTSRASAFDAARFEVPAQKWAQLSDADYAVAVLNDCKYGYDVHAETIRITLIKSATSPDPQADQGHHLFTYSLLPLPGADRATLNHEAYALNNPVRVLAPSETSSETNGTGFARSQSSNVIIETLKPAETGTGVVLRLFESQGQKTNTVIEFSRPPESASLVGFDETILSSLTPQGSTVALDLKPFEVVTLHVTFA